MWLGVCTSNKKLFCYTAYRSEANTDLTYWNKFQENTDNIKDQYNPSNLICGDFNADF